MLYTPHAAPPQQDGIYTAGWAGYIAHDLRAAQNSIALSALSFLPPRPRQTGDLMTLCAALLAGVQRGLQVSIILPQPTKAHGATARNHTAAEWAAANGITAHLVPLPGLLHAKTCLIDRALCWVGSGNLTTAAASHNHEAWIRLSDRHAAAALAAFHHTLRGK